MCSAIGTGLSCYQTYITTEVELYSLLEQRRYIRDIHMVYRFIDVLSEAIKLLKSRLPVSY